MRRIIATILICVLVASLASAGQAPRKPIGWQKAQRLRGGTEIVLTVTGGQPTKVRLLFVGESALFTLKPTAPKLPGRVEKFLFGVGPRWPSVIDDGGSYTFEHWRVSPDGIFDRDERVAELSDVVQQTPRVDVRAILGPPSHRLRNALIVTAVGVGLFFLIAVLNGGWD